MFKNAFSIIGYLSVCLSCLFNWGSIANEGRHNRTGAPLREAKLPHGHDSSHGSR